MTGCITVFGGTGFIGRNLVAQLLQSGATVRVAARRPGDVRITTQSANAPEIIRADLLDEVTVGSPVAGADAAFNLVGILTETGPQTYRAIHVEGACRVQPCLHVVATLSHYASPVMETFARQVLVEAPNTKSGQLNSERWAERRMPFAETRGGKLAGPIDMQ